MNSVGRSQFVLRFILLLGWFIALPVFGQLVSKEIQPSDRARLEQYKQQIEKNKQLQNNYELVKYLFLTANIYWNNNSTKEAVEYINEAIAVNQQIGNQNAIKQLNNNLGILYSESGDYASALDHFQISLKISRDMKKKAEVAYDLLNIGLTLQNMKQYAESNKYLDEAVSLTTEMNDEKSLRTCYGMLSENYDKLGNSAKALQYNSLYTTLQKHLQQQELDQADMRTRQAETEKQAKEVQLQSTVDTLNQVMEVSRERQMQIQLLNKEKELQSMTLAEQSARLRSQRIFTFSLAFGLVLLLVIAALIWVQFQAKKKANQVLASKNEEISQQKQKIDDSIHYAHRIQKAVLIPRPDLEKRLPRNFVFFKPREMVSGDFLWFSEHASRLFIAVVDCTGHGVPGAFMSMLGISFLNEIVSHLPTGESVPTAAGVLNDLRTHVIGSLHQSGARKESKDGMDIALVIWDPAQHSLQFAAAHNALYLVRTKQLITYEADRMPISIHRLADKPFTNHSIDLQKDDRVYLFTDGYHDQAGGEDGRKFLSRNFKQLLLDIHQEPLERQKALLGSTMEQWMGKTAQRDDMLVMGMQFD